MSGWGQVLNTDPDYVLDISRPPSTQSLTTCDLTSQPRFVPVSDLATARAALTLLAVTYWRSQRLHAGVQALAHAFTGADSGADGEDSPMELVWDLTVPAAAATETVLRFLAGVTTGNADSTVQALDAATGLLVSVGRRGPTGKAATTSRHL